MDPSAEGRLILWPRFGGALVAAACVALFAHAALAGQPGHAQLWVGVVCTVTLVLIALHDARTGYVPERAPAVGTALAAGGLLFVGLSGDWTVAVQGMLGAAAACAMTAPVALWNSAAMGFGDVKAAAIAGISVGLQLVLPALFLASFIAALASLLLLARRRASRRDTLPFTPFLALGCALAISIWDPYLWSGT